MVALRACIGSAKQANDCEPADAPCMERSVIIFSPRDARMNESMDSMRGQIGAPRLQGCCAGMACDNVNPRQFAEAVRT
jgi:hypothetical protein